MRELWIGATIAVLGLSGVEILVRRGGGRRWAASRRQIVIGSLVALLGLLAAAPRLGLRYGETLVPRIVAGALFLLLLVYLGQLLPRLRPLLGDSLPRTPPAVFFWLPLVVYLAFTPWASRERQPDGDEPYYLLVTHSLAYDLDAELTNDYADEHSRAFMDRALEAQPSDPRGPNGEMYSRHNVLLPAVLAPAYRLGGRLGALAMMCVIAAVLPWMTLRLGRHFFADRPGPALIAYFILAFSSPLFIYSHQVWVEVPAALLLALALDGVWTLAADQDRHWRTWLPILLPVALLPLLKIRFLLVAGPVLLLLAWRLGRRRRRLVVLACAGCAALAGAILAFNYMRYGNILKYHDLSRLGFYWSELDRYPRGLAGLFFDSAFGLFATAPIWALLLAPGRDKSKTLWLLAAVMGPYILLLVPRSEWYGAWSPPFRYGTVALALFALALIPSLERRRTAGARFVFGALVTATALLSALWVARPGWTYNIAHGRSHVVDFLTTGQGLDMARFFPSGVRPNLALWLWPLLASGAIALGWRWPRRRLDVTWLGAAAPVVGLVILIAVAHRLPTRIAQAEDPYIAHQGGAVWPDDWVVGRSRFRGSWRLRRRDTVTIPVVAGGAYCSLAIDYKRFGRSRPYLRIRPGRLSPVLVQLPETRDWKTIEIGDLPWPPEAETLEISLQLPPRVDPQAAILLDRVRFTWSDRPR
jgi:hypothetical protein